MAGDAGEAGATHRSASAYRADIDGLRAIAVLVVVFFHAGIAGFPGGYAGVDVFFVISGFLITKIILDDQRAGGFSFARFYERRIRRIIPALYALLATTLLMSLTVLVPQDVIDAARSAIAAALFCSNFYFWNGTSYFAAPDQVKPLLHTWSLGVEEQFYLFYPVLLVTCDRYFAKWRTGFLILLLLLSFVLAVVGNALHWTAAFFLAPSRAWELLLGALLNAPVILDLRLSHFSRAALAFLGLALVTAPVCLLDSGSPLSFLTIALPCLGTALLIFANRDSLTPAGRLLSLRPVVWLGAISYSLYLWHWPMLVLARQYALRPLFAHETAAVLVASVVAATLSHYLVERPFRDRSLMPSRHRIFVGYAAATLLLAVGAGSIDLFKGFPQGYSPAVATLLQFEDYDISSIYRRGTCFAIRRSDYDAAKCFAPKSNRRSVLVWGDSHAAHYFLGIEKLGNRRGLDVSEAAFTGCLPLVEAPSLVSNQCSAFNSAIMALIDARHPDIVVISGHWLKFYTRDNEALLAALDNTASYLAARHIKVVVMGPGIEYTDYAPRLIARLLARNGDKRTPDIDDNLIGGLFDLDQVMGARLSHLPNVSYVSILASVCPKRHCPAFVRPGVPFVWDTAHLTAAGGEYVTQVSLGTLR